jgi:MFS family permease
VVVWACFGSLAVIFGVSYSFAAFFASFAAEFAAQRADVALVFGLCGLIYFVLGVGGGMLADRFGPRTLCMTGMACLGLPGAVGIGHRGVGAFGGRQGQLTTAGYLLSRLPNLACKLSAPLAPGKLLELVQRLQRVAG